MRRKLKILVLIKPFWRAYPKHRQKFGVIKALEKLAEVKYWYKDGNIHDILSELEFQPDFIYHYETAWRYSMAPKITGLDTVNIPKGCFVNDLHYKPTAAQVRKYGEESRTSYIDKNKIDLIFCPVKHSFFQVYPQYRDKHRWLPWSINPYVIKDWGLRKSIDYLLMGQFHYRGRKYRPRRNPPKGNYKFREVVFRKMQHANGFVYHPHPGHSVRRTKGVMINARYARELNRSKIFFTCGGQWQCAVFKFFEAPGCKTLLLAEPNADVLELGFKDGVNFVACNEFNVEKKAQYYLKNVRERRRITNAGYAFIHKYHTNRVRARQFINYVEDFLRRKQARGRRVTTLAPM
ncbi:glycosyltransferase [Paenibacillus xerothermodurans]|uniref:Glycosyltransferase family 1 protein n=1 Tax=Paenibacillus xerothermodurans TaxID=1977292 RepID=A0A2W1NNT9_PAEXE|nr:glycosyltransferase [Paenibacillus xerothermodurans]PZE21135.1 glycosyltransferase family 1 protein [Paenibacillus xerothermodurans]